MGVYLAIFINLPMGSLMKYFRISMPFGVMAYFPNNIFVICSHQSFFSFALFVFCLLYFAINGYKVCP